MEKDNFGCTSNDLKCLYYYNHPQTFGLSDKISGTELLEAIWRAKDTDMDPQIKWSLQLNHFRTNRSQTMQPLPGRKTRHPECGPCHHTKQEV